MYFSARKVPKAWGVATRPTPLTLHKCGMLCLLQIAEILNLAHVVHSHEKFLCDLRNPIATCSFHSPWLWSCSPQTTRLLFGEYSPNPFIGRIISAPTRQRVILNEVKNLIHDMSNHDSQADVGISPSKLVIRQEQAPALQCGASTVRVGAIHESPVYEILHYVQNDTLMRKGFGEYSPNNNRVVCGEQDQSQGE